ncbi:uncharacterized protein LOC111525899 [Piliocolobus tephrosceles]|uniref:uncharacterized protein LOC111525899 n=1 Tax=Piliocolobus tephrosceles TaxID=591936 RepID=UPI000C2A52D0|nr:uncharacterized protein LOC111525899 [Piliocolobus tephrosceles]
MRCSHPISPDFLLERFLGPQVFLRGRRGEWRQRRLEAGKSQARKPPRTSLNAAPSRGRSGTKPAACTLPAAGAASSRLRPLLQEDPAARVPGVRRRIRRAQGEGARRTRLPRDRPRPQRPRDRASAASIDWELPGHALGAGPRAPGGGAAVPMASSERAGVGPGSLFRYLLPSLGMAGHLCLLSFAPCVLWSPATCSAAVPHEALQRMP